MSGLLLPDHISHILGTEYIALIHPDPVDKVGEITQNSSMSFDSGYYPAPANKLSRQMTPGKPGYSCY